MQERNSYRSRFKLKSQSGSVKGKKKRRPPNGKKQNVRSSQESRMRDAYGDNHDQGGFNGQDSNADYGQEINGFDSQYTQPLE